MTDAIDYRENGTIVITLDDTYTLRVPTADEMLRWHEQVLERLDGVNALFDELQAKVAAAVEDSPEHREAARELNAFSRRPAYDFTLAWVEEVTDVLCDDFPPRDTWPAWLTGQDLPTKFVKHWREVPKVSGSGNRK